MLAVLLFATGCDQSRYSLVANVADSEKRFQDGRYPDFINDAGAGDQGLVELAGETRPALTPPFPASLRFDVVLPEAAFLTLAPALITRQRVGRARVEFVVVVETSDGERTTVFSELLRHTETNRWHPREIDLTRWAGQSVTLELTTRELEGRTDMLWADRVQAVWGEPVVGASPGKRFAAATHELVGVATDVLASQSEAVGISREDVGSLWRFAVNIVIGGLLSIVIGAVFRRFGSTTSGRHAFSNLFPLFTIATIVVMPWFALRSCFRSASLARCPSYAFARPSSRPKSWSISCFAPPSEFRSGPTKDCSRSHRSRWCARSSSRAISDVDPLTEIYCSPCPETRRVFTTATRRCSTEFETSPVGSDCNGSTTMARTSSFERS